MTHPVDLTGETNLPVRYAWNCAFSKGQERLKEHINKEGFPHPINGPFLRMSLVVTVADEDAENKMLSFLQRFCKTVCVDVILYLHV